MIIINTRSWIWPADDDAASPQKIYFLEYFTGCNHLDLAAFITAWVTTPTHARITVDLISINNVNVLQDALEGSDRCWGSDRILPSSFWFSSPRNYWIIISDWCCACSCFVSISFQFLTGLRGYLIWWGFWISLGISLLGSLRLCHICNRDSQRFSEILEDSLGMAWDVPWLMVSGVLYRPVGSDGPSFIKCPRRFSSRFQGIPERRWRCIPQNSSSVSENIPAECWWCASVAPSEDLAGIQREIWGISGRVKWSPKESHKIHNHPTKKERKYRLENISQSFLFLKKKLFQRKIKVISRSSISPWNQWRICGGMCDLTEVATAPKRRYHQRPPPLNSASPCNRPVSQRRAFVNDGHGLLRFR